MRSLLRKVIVDEGSQVRHGETEVFGELVCGARGAEATHGEGDARFAEVAFPTEGRGGFHGDTLLHVRRQHAVAISGALGFEEFPARHGDHADVACIGLSRFEGERDFRTRCDYQSGKGVLYGILKIERTEFGIARCGNGDHSCDGKY